MFSNSYFINIFFFFILIILIQIFLYIKLKKYNYILDKDFKKPQAIHTKAIPRIGGIIILIPLLILFTKSFFDQDEPTTFLLIFFIISTFVVGFLDDCRLIINPFIKFSILIFSTTFFVIYYDLSIKSFGIELIDKIKNFYIFSIILTVASIFIVTNGANLIDGFNGLLLINSIISLFSFAVTSYILNEFIIFQYCIFFIFTLIIPLLLNFPKARIFMGDSGAYVCGVFLAIIGIKLSQNNQISPFYIGSLLSYFAIETVFSIIRKVFEKKSPFNPDNLHLHLILFSLLIKKRIKHYSFLTTIYIIFINFIFFFISTLFFYDTFVTKILFISYLISYVLIYFFIRKKNFKFSNFSKLN
jgi:UDP-GlcNAc:undecaprenyl-phosphate GlcNAc-1-phosphate transferase